MPAWIFLFVNYKILHFGPHIPSSRMDILAMSKSSSNHKYLAEELFLATTEESTEADPYRKSQVLDRQKLHFSLFILTFSFLFSEYHSFVLDCVIILNLLQKWLMSDDDYAMVVLLEGLMVCLTKITSRQRIRSMIKIPNGVFFYLMLQDNVAKEN